MNMNRRSFIGTVLALGAAPAIVRAERLMPMSLRARALPLFYGTFRATAPILQCSDLVESVIHDGPITTYSYHTENLAYAVPNGSEVLKIWLDGVEMPTDTFVRTSTGLLVRKLSLDAFGCRVPNMTVEMVKELQ